LATPLPQYSKGIFYTLCVTANNGLANTKLCKINALNGNSISEKDLPPTVSDFSIAGINAGFGQFTSLDFSGWKKTLFSFKLP